MLPVPTVDTDVLARIFRGTGTLNTDITVTKHEVVFGSERGVIEDIRRKVRLLVVLGTQRMSVPQRQYRQRHSAQWSDGRHTLSIDF